MKILTWNLAGGHKRAAVASLDADLVALQERRHRDLLPDEHCVGAPDKGVSVRARAPFTSRPMASDVELPRYFLPYQVDGPARFQFINVWAMNEGQDKYVRGTVRAANLWRDRLCEQPTVLAGDFNANCCWDAEHPPDRNFSALVRIFREAGLVSAYHAFFGEEHGSESRPTFHFYRHRDRPFHLDYCFIPEAWLPRLRSVTLGGFDEWSRFSDHMPLSVDVEL